MLCQWPASHRIGDRPARSAQHEYRFPTIIQLDEVAPPPLPQKTSFSPVPSSSQSYDYWTSSEEYDEAEGGEEEEEEEATESYCSSDPSCPGFGMEDSERGSATASAPVEQKVKMSRVLAWRNSFDSAFADENAGMSSSVSCCALGFFPPYPLLLLATYPCPADLGFVGVPAGGTYVPDFPLPLARAIAFGLFFSRSLLSPAALMSLKRKYSNEPESGENGQVEGKQGSSDAVSPPFPTPFLLFQPVHHQTVFAPTEE